MNGNFCPFCGQQGKVIYHFNGTGLPPTCECGATVNVNTWTRELPSTSEEQETIIDTLETSYSKSIIYLQSKITHRNRTIRGLRKPQIGVKARG